MKTKEQIIEWLPERLRSRVPDFKPFTDIDDANQALAYTMAILDELTELASRRFEASVVRFGPDIEIPETIPE